VITDSEFPFLFCKRMVSINRSVPIDSCCMKFIRTISQFILLSVRKAVYQFFVMRFLSKDQKVAEHVSAIYYLFYFGEKRYFGASTARTSIFSASGYSLGLEELLRAPGDCFEWMKLFCSRLGHAWGLYSLFV
jgi:hypothetical protein